MTRFDLLKATMTGALVLALALSAAAEDPREIIRRMEDNIRGDASYREMTMEIVRPRYTREISLRSWTLGEDLALVQVTAPARDKGTASLKRGHEIWNYQPAIDRTIKLPPSMMSQSWMGSDLSNDDLVRAASLVDDFTHEFLGTETAEGHECFVVELTPKPENPVVYEKIRYWIAKKHDLPVRIENYDERGELVNTVFFRDIREMGGRWIPALMEIAPAGEEGRRTVVVTRKAEFDIDISNRFFSLDNLTRIR